MMWLRSGRLVDPLGLDFNRITLEDLAWALAHVNRWGGHADPAINVAQHAVACCRATWAMPRLALLCLHHDDGEAFFGDMCRDLKSRPEMDWYRRQEHMATLRCVEHFAPECSGLALEASKDADTASLLTERAYRFPADKDQTSYHPEHVAPLAPALFQLDPMRMVHGDEREMPGPGGAWARSWLWCHYQLKARLQEPSSGQ